MEGAINAKERRATFRLFSYWIQIKGETKYPLLSSINPKEIPNLWPYLFVIRLGETPEFSRFQHFGTGLQEIYEQDFGGCTIAEALEDVIFGPTIGYYEKIVEGQAPGVESSSFQMSKKDVKYRSLIAPISSDGKEIDYLIGTSNYKIFE